LNFGLFSATALWQKVLAGHRLNYEWLTKVIFFQGIQTESQKNRLLWYGSSSALDPRLLVVLAVPL